MTLVINALGGPGSRKSTMISSVFSELKWLGINCEYASEYAKDKVWEESFHALDNQIMVFGKQHHRIWRLLGKTDVVLVDSPLLLSIIYDKSKSAELRKLVLKEFNKCTNMNYFIVRKSKFNQSGRMQNERQSKVKDEEIRKLLIKEKIKFTEIDGVKENVSVIVNDILEKLNVERPCLACGGNGYILLNDQGDLDRSIGVECLSCEGKGKIQ